MKYFKFTQISGDTGISWAIAQPVSGPCYPPLPGLNNVIQLNYNNLYYICEVSDEATPNPENFCFEISVEERAQELKTMIDWEIKKNLNEFTLKKKNFVKLFLISMMNPLSSLESINIKKQSN